MKASVLLTLFGKYCVLTCVLTQELTDWFKIARDDLRFAITKRQNTNIAKNVILFVGEGMGFSTITASRILRGQLNGNPGEETVLAFEKFPNNGLIKTYSVDAQVSEGGATQTAMLCGIKTKARLLGLRETASFNNCSSQFGAEVSCIMEWFNEQERSVGIVSDDEVTAPLAAGGYAKSASRLWEGDSRQSDSAIEQGCEDIAKQLVLRNPFIRVIFGGGRRFFLTNTTLDPENGTIFQDQQRRDGNDLIDIWLRDKRFKRKRAKYVWNKEQFDSIVPRETDFALGLFSAAGLVNELDRNKGPKGEPSLSEMTRKAIQILSKNRKGYFLIVGANNIDFFHHDNNAKRALFQTLEMENSIKVALDMTRSTDTMIIVTASFDQMLKIAGFPDRGNDILGIAQPGPGRTPDGLPWTTLVYGNGPGYDFGNRVNLTNVDTKADDFVQVSAVPVSVSTHSGEDVPIYATGPWSHLIHSTHEQHYIAHVMAYASCVGPYKSRCVRKRSRHFAGTYISRCKRRHREY